ncbi:MAG: glycine--tRNA ligase subunit beta, partial [Anaerolineales bacterium]
KDGGLLPFFIGVRNGDEQFLDVVTDGNEQVIRARFADASFFINEDLKHKLEDFLPRLGTLMFQTKLGSMLNKSQRIEKLVELLMPLLNLSPDEANTARRAARLCKADLVTHMVIEMTSLQGIMGHYYALKSGETPAVAQAIFEHYLPRFTGDKLPEGNAGLLIGLADRLDTLAGLFAAGLAPSGTKDPFAQRRAALGLVQLLIARDLDFDLRNGLAEAASLLPIPAKSESLKECLDFIAGRLRVMLIDQGYRYDIVDAVLAIQKHNPAGCMRAVRELSEWVARPDWHTILPAFARCVRILRTQPGEYTLRPELFDTEEQALYQALQKAENTARRPGSAADFLIAFEPMIPAINRFFDQVLVMAEDMDIRANRLALVQRVANLAAGVADLSLLEGF